MTFLRYSNRYRFVFVGIQTADHRSRRDQRHFVLAAPPSKQHAHPQPFLVFCHASIPMATVLSLPSMRNGGVKRVAAMRSTTNVFRASCSVTRKEAGQISTGSIVPLLWRGRGA